MTCEIAVLNKHAVVIAADSAVTYSNGSAEKRYSKGGNKIFQLSHHHPVGVMIYDSGSIMGIPWELVIKEFRDHLGTSSFDTVERYAHEFLKFLRQNLVYFPAVDRTEAFDLAVKDRLLRLLLDATTSHPVLRDGVALEARRDAWGNFVRNERERLNDATILSNIDPQVEVALKEEAGRNFGDFARQVADTLAENGKIFISDVFDAVELAELAALAFTRDFQSYSSKTGIVFCGYGRAQIFPSVYEVSVAGFIGDDVIFEIGNHTIIAKNLESQILQFATTSMVDVFTQGYGFDIWIAVRRAFEEKARELVESILTDLGQLEAVPNLSERLRNSEVDFRNQWTDELRESHYANLRRSIGTLPVDEMVHLAETMIVLESLKEKVTSPSQSVGGPVDIAVITRNEGLVWVKRKHFFDASSNPRYVLRQQQNYR